MAKVAPRLRERLCLDKSDADFEASFRAYVLRIFLFGAAGPLLVYGLARLLRAAAAGSW